MADGCCSGHGSSTSPWPEEPTVGEVESVRGDHFGVSLMLSALSAVIYTSGLDRTKFRPAQKIFVPFQLVSWVYHHGIDKEAWTPESRWRRYLVPVDCAYQSMGNRSVSTVSSAAWLKQAWIHVQIQSLMAFHSMRKSALHGNFTGNN